MNFKVSKEIFEKFPGLTIGIVVAKDIDNTGKNEEILSLIREKENEIRENFDTGSLSQNPKINVWRKAYSSFGAKPKKNKCSVENLYRQILSENSLRHLNKIVDLYNYISIKHLIPVGGDDLDKVEGNIVLRPAKGDEKFLELNSKETSNPKPGEIVYVDDSEVLCRQWNWRECDKTKMTTETKNVALVIEGLAIFKKEEIESISKELSESINKFCNGETELFILNSEKTEIGF